MDTTLTIVTAVLTSSVVAGLVAGVFADRNDRRKQIRDQRIALAGEFAGGAMGVLAVLERLRPPRGPRHGNLRLRTDQALRDGREAKANDAIDQLRPLRGKVWVVFPGRTPGFFPGAPGFEHPQTTSDWAECVVADLRSTVQICENFWTAWLDSTSDAERDHIEEACGLQYDLSRARAWTALNWFTETAAQHIGVGPSRGMRRRGAVPPQPRP